MKTVYSLPHTPLTTAKTTKILSLDDQLKDTLLNSHVDSDLKARLYQNILQEYLNMKKTDPAPNLIQPQIIKTEPPKQEQPDTQDFEDTVLETIPLSQYKNAEELLKKLTYHKTTGELLDSDGSVIKGSNVKKLLKGYISSSQRAKKHTRKLIGYSTFKSQIGQGFRHERCRWTPF